MGINDKEPEIVVTDETKAVIEHYLQKQHERIAKRKARKQEGKHKEVWDPRTGKFTIVK